jgi:hypothetical protein
VGDLFGSESTQTVTYEPFSGRYKQWYEQLQPYLYKKATTPATYSGDVSASLNPTQQAMISRLSGYTDNPTLAAYARGTTLTRQKTLTSRAWPNRSKSRRPKRGEYRRPDQHGGQQDRVLVGQRAFQRTGGCAERPRRSRIRRIGKPFQHRLSARRVQHAPAGQQQQSAAQAALQGGNVQYQVEQAAAQAEYQKWLAEQGLQNNAISQYLYYLATGKNPTTTTTKESEGGLGSLLGTVADGLNWNKIFGVK